MTKKINASYLSMPLNGDKYEEIDGSVTAEEIEQLVKKSTEGIIYTSKDEDGRFPFQAVEEK